MTRLPTARLRKFRDGWENILTLLHMSFFTRQMQSPSLLKLQMHMPTSLHDGFVLFVFGGRSGIGGNSSAINVMDMSLYAFPNVCLTELNSGFRNTAAMRATDPPAVLLQEPIVIPSPEDSG